MGKEHTITPHERTMLDFAEVTPGLWNLLWNIDLLPEQVLDEPRRWDLMLQIIAAVRSMLTTERDRADAIESRAREVLRTGEETERSLAEYQSGWAQAVAEIAALEADLAAMRGKLEQIAESDWQESDPDGHGVEVPKMKPWDMWELAKAALASSPGAATRETERATVVADVGECCRGADPACASGCLVERALRKRVEARVATQTAEAMPEGWRETAREVVDLLIAHHESWERGEDGDALDAPTRALLARPKVQGMRRR